MHNIFRPFSLSIVIHVCHIYCMQTTTINHITFWVFLNAKRKTIWKCEICLFNWKMFQIINQISKKLQPATITKQVSSPTLVVPASTNIQPLSPPKPFPIAPLPTNPIKTISPFISKVNVIHIFTFLTLTFHSTTGFHTQKTMSKLFYITFSCKRLSICIRFVSVPKCVQFSLLELKPQFSGKAHF